MCVVRVHARFILALVRMRRVQVVAHEARAKDGWRLQGEATASISALGDASVEVVEGVAAATAAVAVAAAAAAAAVVVRAVLARLR